MIFFTALAWLAYVVDQVGRLGTSELGARAVLETAGYFTIVTTLTASALAYLVARLGHLHRVRSHRRVPRSVIDDFFDASQPSVTVLVPSYREEPRVIRQTLLSATLQEYPGLRTVLLIDDPPEPSDAEGRRLLDAALALPGEITELLREPHDRAVLAYERFDRTTSAEGPAGVDALNDLALAYHDAIDWLRAEANAVASAPESDRSDMFLADRVLGGIADDLEATAGALREAARSAELVLSVHRLRQLHRRLVWIFESDVFSFERKRFASLSHEPNKAMNLNSYLGLMGKRFQIERSPKATVLVEQGMGADGLSVPDSDFVLTLDADSVLLPEYCIRLVHLMSQPEHRKVAVAQTPYSAFGGGSRIERIAGATTDVQHIVHQGLTHYGATFWVGANALIRKAALDELRVDDTENGFVVSRFIADRTVIEDTESSIDLRARGWQLINYPERLSYSATPPDFGSLVVQRKRWANGGVVIVPRLARLSRHRKQNSSPPSFVESFLRLGYLASISWVSLGLLVLLVYPFDQHLLSYFAIGAAVPYFVATAVDLRRCGYRRRDVIGIYAFNLMLLPVNLAGTVSSLVQAIGGHKVDFARTPKVQGRTSAPMLFIVLPVVLLAWSCYTLARSVTEGNLAPAIFAAVNALALTYAVLAYVGPVAAVVDICLGLRSKVFVAAKPEPTWTAPVPEWASVLFVGGDASDDPQHWAPLALALSARDQVLTGTGLVSRGAAAGFDDHVRGRGGADEEEVIVDLRSDRSDAEAPDSIGAPS